MYKRQVYIGQPPFNRNIDKNDKEITKFIKKKLDRTEKFYRYGLSKVGWNKYSYIDVEFDNQIICKRKTIHKQPKEQSE